MALFANKSAVSFPKMPLWAGIQMMVIFRFAESATFNWFLMDKMMKLWLLEGF